LRAELIASEANSFIADSAAPSSLQAFDVAVTEVESVIKPDCILDDFRQKSVALIPFRLGHTTDPARLGVNLSAPKRLLDHPTPGLFIVMLYCTAGVGKLGGTTSISSVSSSNLSASMTARCSWGSSPLLSDSASW